jgi:AraC-like DNA-binding protein
MTGFTLIERVRPGKRPGRYNGLFNGARAPMLHAAEDAQMTVERADFGGFTIGRVTSTGHDVRLMETRKLSVLLPLAGTLTTEFQDRTQRARSGQILIASRGLRSTRVQRPANRSFQAIVLMLDQMEFGRMSRPITRSRDMSALTGEFCLSVDTSRGAQAAQLASLLGMLAENLALDRQFARTQSVVSGWNMILQEQLLSVLEESVLQPVAAAPPDISQAHVSRAIAYMHQNFADIAIVAKVARELGISVRTLEVAFRKLCDKSPARMLAEIRLDAARQLLLRDEKIRTVADAAFDCGFGHPGRFALAYRQRFGEAPSETLSTRLL